MHWRYEENKFSDHDFPGFFLCWTPRFYLKIIHIQVKYILTLSYDLDSLLRRIHDRGVLWIQTSLLVWWYISLYKCRIDRCRGLPRTTVTPSLSRPEAKTSSVLYTVCGIARADRERWRLVRRFNRAEDSEGWQASAWQGEPLCEKCIF